MKILFFALSISFLMATGKHASQDTSIIESVIDAVTDLEKIEKKVVHKIAAEIGLEEIPTNKVELIIFIHGTIKPPEISFSSLMKIMADKVDGTIYGRATEHMRKDAFFYRGQPIQELGLKPITIAPEGTLDVTTRTAQTIVDIYNFQYGLQEQKPSKRLYYTFGWNGLLSESKRYEAARDLCGSLQKEIERLKNQHFNPIITLVTYSHGGNVALYLSSIQAEKEQSSDPLSIDTLVLLACPIQKETDYLVADPMFKKVYNIFSTEDFIQQWDLFSSREQFFSQRMFKDRKKFKVPSKVVQIRVRVTKKIRCITPDNIKDDIDTLINLPLKCFEHRDPGHMEIGGFSWGNYWYRDIFPLFPLPIIALIPTIITTTNTALPKSTDLVFDFIPHLNCALLTDNNSKQKSLKVLWSQKERIELWNTISSSIPLDFTFYNQEEHIAKALQQARNEFYSTKDGRKYRKPHSRTLARLLRKADKNEFDTNPLIAQSKKHYGKAHRFTHYNII